jgi:hypothetical protein
VVAEAVTSRPLADGSTTCMTPLTRATSSSSSHGRSGGPSRQRGDAVGSSTCRTPWAAGRAGLAADLGAAAAQVARVEENTASVVLTTDQLQRLNALTPTTGARHDEANMASIDR